jgi:hypothetical protein
MQEPAQGSEQVFLPFNDRSPFMRNRINRAAQRDRQGASRGAPALTKFRHTARRAAERELYLPYRSVVLFGVPTERWLHAYARGVCCVDPEPIAQVELKASA